MYDRTTAFQIFRECGNNPRKSGIFQYAPRIEALFFAKIHDIHLFFNIKFIKRIYE